MNPTKLTLTATGNLNRRLQWIPLAILVAISGLVATQADAEDRLAGDLFSAITMSDTTNSKSDHNHQSAKQQDEVLGVISLSKIFTREKIQYEVQSTTVLVRVADLSPNDTGTTNLGKLQLSVNAESQRIDVMLPLSAATKNKAAEGKELMSLLVRLSNVSGVHLTATEQAIALHTSLSNQDVTLQDLQTAAERLIAAAKKAQPNSTAIGSDQATAGSVVAAAAQPAKAVQPVGSTPEASKAAATTTKLASVVGTWSAKTSATDAWAIRFNADASFVMVHTRSGKNSVSRGNYTFDSNQLVVSETAGVSLKGQVNRISEKSFAWKLQNDSGQTLITLTFKKK